MGHTACMALRWYLEGSEEGAEQSSCVLCKKRVKVWGLVVLTTVFM